MGAAEENKDGIGEELHAPVPTEARILVEPVTVVTGPVSFSSGGQESEETTVAAALLVECGPANSTTSVVGVASSSPIPLEAIVAQTDDGAVVVHDPTQEHDPQAIITSLRMESRGLRTVNSILKRANSTNVKRIKDLEEVIEMKD